MPTGALIRDFHKEYRELRFTTSGSFELSEIEHNAYLQRLTVQIDEIDSQRYLNRKTLPDHSHYGYLTMFKGTSVTERLPVEFPKQRVFEQINQGIWNYHQSTEDRLIEGAEKSSLIRKIFPDGFASDVLDSAFDWLDNQFIWTYDLTLARYLITFGAGEFVGVGAGGGGEGANTYRAYPVASPFPDIFKFKGDIPLSFRFRLESWYLVNPAVYILDNPTDTDDETEGEDEYPEPDIGDGDGAGDEFPEPDPIPSGRDPRDFPDGAGSSDWFPGARVRVTYTKYPYQEGCIQLTQTAQIELGASAPGSYSISYIGSVNGCEGAQTAGGLRLLTPTGATVDLAVLQEQQWQSATVDSVVYFTP